MRMIALKKINLQQYDKPENKDGIKTQKRETAKLGANIRENKRD